MPSILTHPAVAIGVLPWFPALRRPRVLIAGAALTALPDLDVLGFGWGIPYGHLFGHRGLSHSISFGVLVGVLMALALSRRLAVSRAPLGIYFSLCIVSHGLLDCITSGGKGIALLAPFSSARFFAPFRPIQVSPIGIMEFFGEWGRRVLASELRWVWLPFMVIGILGLLLPAPDSEYRGAPGIAGKGEQQ